MWSVYVLEAPLAHVHPYVACIFVEMYFLALSMCRIVQYPIRPGIRSYRFDTLVVE